MEARAAQARAVLSLVGLDRSSALKFRAILTCDCNSDLEWGDESMEILTSEFDDAWSMGTGPGFTGTGDSSQRRIDYVLVEKLSGIPIDSAAVDYTPGLSDHFPVVADL